MGRLLQLAPLVVSLESKNKIAALLQEIERGNVVGVAFIALHPGHQYFADATGTAKDFPTIARGAIQALNDQLGILAGSK